MRKPKKANPRVDYKLIYLENERLELNIDSIVTMMTIITAAIMVLFVSWVLL